MKNGNLYDLTNVGVKIFPGIHRMIEAAAADLGVSLSEWFRAAVWTEPSKKGPRLVVRMPDQASIAVIGTKNRIVGSLADVMANPARLDWPESTNFLADARLPILARSEDLERRADGSLTGRLSDARRIRRPGRIRGERLARARALIDDLDTSGAR